MKDKYESAVEELDQLIQKKTEIENKELMKAIEKSDRTADEIIAFLNGQEME